MATPEHLQFFAVIYTPDMVFDLRRVSLSRTLQLDLSRLFVEQAREFLGNNIAAIEFSPSYTPHHDEVVVIRGFALPNHLQRALEAPQEFDDLSFPFTPQAPMVKAILAADIHKRELYFQYFDRSRILRKDRTAIFKSGMFQKLDEPGITIDSHLSALIADGNLHFRSFHRVRQFLDLGDFFKEATNEDIESLLSHDKLDVGDPDNVLSSLSDRMRRRFSIVMATGILDHEKVTPERIQSRAKKFDNLDVKLSGKAGNRKVIFPTDATTMGLFLKFLSEELYISELTDQQREANSSRPFA